MNQTLIAAGINFAPYGCIINKTSVNRSRIRPAFIKVSFDDAQHSQVSKNSCYRT